MMVKKKRLLILWLLWIKKNCETILKYLRAVIQNHESIYFTVVWVMFDLCTLHTVKSRNTML